MNEARAPWRWALRAEWTKLRTSPGTFWLLLAVVVATVAVSALAGAAITCRASGCVTDLTKLSLTGVQLGQAVVAIVAVLSIGNEYSTGMVRTTLAAVPRRTTLMAVKAVVIIAVVALAAVPAVAGALLSGRILLPAHDFQWRPAVGSVLYLELIALLSLGLATALRNPAAAIGAVLGLLYVWPILTAVVGDPTWKRHLEQAGPMSAGTAVQSTINLSSLPIGPWAGLGVLGLWSAGALLLGWLLLVTRDA